MPTQKDKELREKMHKEIKMMKLKIVMYESSDELLSKFPFFCLGYGVFNNLSLQQIETLIDFFVKEGNI